MPARGRPASMIRLSDATCPPHTTTTVRDADVIPMRRGTHRHHKALLEQSHRRAIPFNLSRGPIGAETRHHHPHHRDHHHHRVAGRDVAGREGSLHPLDGSTTWPKKRRSLFLASLFSLGLSHCFCFAVLASHVIARGARIPASRASTPWDRNHTHTHNAAVRTLCSPQMM